MLALPPGGGKTSLFGALSDAGWAVASSDGERARGGNFDNALAALLQKHARVGYDKNVPNADGLRKLIKVVAAAQRRGGWDVRLVVVVPDRIDHDLSWGRVRARAASDAALSVHIDGGEREAYRIFRTVFYDACLAFRPAAAALPGAVTSAAFWESVDAAHALARQLAAPDILAAAPLLSEVEAALDGGGAAGGRGGAHCWASAELPRTRLHLTLVPPDHRPADRAAAAARAAALRRLGEHAGRAVGVGVVRYHLATWAPTGGGGGGGGGGKGGRRDGGARQCGLWEVSGVAGLPEDAHYAPQRPLYHITDLASLVGCAPRDAVAVVDRLRRGDAEAGCTLTTLDTPPELEGALPVEVAARIELKGGAAEH